MMANRRLGQAQHLAKVPNVAFSIAKQEQDIQASFVGKQAEQRGKLLQILMGGRQLIFVHFDDLTLQLDGPFSAHTISFPIPVFRVGAMV
jgi:hypothetical protein